MRIIFISAIEIIQARLDNRILELTVIAHATHTTRQHSRFHLLVPDNLRVANSWQGLQNTFSTSQANHIGSIGSAKDNMEPQNFKDILYAKDATGVVTLTLNTPARKNALSAVTFLEIFYAVDHFQSDDSAYAMILTGAKDPQSEDPTKEAFSSGGYFNSDAFEGIPPEILADIDMSDIAQKRATLKLYACDKPIIAAINGLAIGGGVTLCLAAADQIYMSEHAWLQLPFAKLGIAAELGSTYFLPRLLGFQKAKEILFFAERISANDAVELGIANKVVSHSELLSYSREKVLQLIPPQGPSLSIREMKRCLHQPHMEALGQALEQENAALATLMATEDFVEGIMARVERRPPVFKGK